MVKIKRVAQVALGLLLLALPAYAQTTNNFTTQGFAWTDDPRIVNGLQPSDLGQPNGPLQADSSGGIGLYLGTTAGKAAAGNDPRLTSLIPLGSTTSRTYVSRTADYGLNVKDFGALCDGTTDDTAAFQRAITYDLTLTYGQTIHVPGGRCMLSSRLVMAETGNQAISFEGQGQDVTELVWTTPAAGMSFVFSGSIQQWLRTTASPAQVARVSNLSLVYAGSSGVATNPALLFDGSAATNTRYPPDVTVVNVGVHSQQNSAQAWNDGITFNSVLGGAYLDNVRVVLGETTYAGNAVNLIGPVGNGVQTSNGFYIHHLLAYASTTGVNVGHNIQGVYISDSQFFSKTGVACNSPLADVSTGSVSVVNSDFADINSAIFITNCYQSWISGNQIQLINNTTNAIFVGLQNSEGSHIYDNNIFGPAGTGATGILVSSTQPIASGHPYFISHNMISGIQNGVDVSSGADVFLDNNIYSSNSTDEILQPGNVATNERHSDGSFAPLIVGGAPPGASSCGGAGVAALGNDYSGSITEGAAATGCTVTFTLPHATAPSCIVTSPNGTALTSYSASTTALTLVNPSTSTGQFKYICQP